MQQHEHAGVGTSNQQCSNNILLHYSMPSTIPQVCIQLIQSVYKSCVTVTDATLHFSITAIITHIIVWQCSCQLHLQHLFHPQSSPQPHPHPQNLAIVIKHEGCRVGALGQLGAALGPF